jgi:hypothetical protein
MRTIAAVIAFAAVFVLAGCTTLGIPEFDREQLESDKLDLPSRYADYDQDSIRWLAEYDGFDFYAAKSADGTCLILVRDGDVENSFSGCTAGPELGLSGRDYPTIHLYVDSPPPGVPAGTTALTPNLYVRE